MDQELFSIDGNLRVQFEQKIKTYKNDLDEAKRVFFKYQDRYIVQKNKETMMDNGIKVGYDMENIAVDIKTNLKAQSDKMHKIDQRMDHMNQDMTVSDRLMLDIKKGRRVNKLILYGVVSLICLSVLVIVALRVL
ncbi:vesicle transport v-snare protein vti1 [Stylonychia lemnae]|uniref:Vesicle transport v-snare protein vti1 n=1 Tax=Stylonychia lemnae TaxID=5949 RepID=A0A078AHW7_STYLE|nr:vesicle transport v-snare protein vti1 [Stylonychia lemnae]|eukprot:CDW81501.1 vesicle transport v-snare protein vti1 [Stylonychia lemnae]